MTTSEPLLSSSEQQQETTATAMKAAEAPFPAAEAGAAAATTAVEVEEENKTAAAVAPTTTTTAAPSPSLVPVIQSSRGGGLVEAPPGWNRALASVPAKTNRKKQKSPPPDASSSPQRVAADFLWHSPLPESTSREDERRDWKLFARSRGACVLRKAPLASSLVASSSFPSLEDLAEMSKKGKEEEEEEESDEDDDDEDDDEGRRRRRAAAASSFVPATLVSAGQGAPPELYALDERKNSHLGSRYRIRRPPTFQRSSSAPQGRRGDGGGDLASLAAAALGSGGGPSLLTARLASGGESGGATVDGRDPRSVAREGIDWRWLSSVTSSSSPLSSSSGPPSTPSAPSSCLLPPSAVDCEWACSPPLSPSSPTSDRVVVLPASYATHDRVFAQVRGRRRFLVARPSDALEKCYPLPLSHPLDGFSAVLWRDPDLDRWPRFASLRCSWAELEPGDVLRVPAYWMVHSELIPGPSGPNGGDDGGDASGGRGSVTLVLRSPASRDLRDPGSLVLQAARQAELELCRVFGDGCKVRAATGELLLLASSPSASLASSAASLLASPSTSSPAADASAVAEALSAALSDFRTACLGDPLVLLRGLEAAADARRFTTTRWLEADGGERRLFPAALPPSSPSASRDKPPLYFIDARTPEERKYPSLFRATIEKKARERVPWVPKKEAKKLLLEKKEERVLMLPPP